MKKVILSLLCLLILSASGCSTINNLIGHAIVPESVTIEGVTYRNGFYGDLYPVFGEAGDIGSVTLREEVLYDDGSRKFRRVNYPGHDWVHSHIGQYVGGVVYCAENEWEQTRDYYSEPSNFLYYYGVGYNRAETAINIPEIDPQKFDELLAFGKENSYNLFQRSSKEAEIDGIRRLPESEFQEGVCFFKVSNDGYFMTTKEPMYFVHGDTLLLVFYHDGGSRNGGTEEVAVVDVPNELGQYFIGLMKLYH